MVLETEIKHLRAELRAAVKELRTLITAKNQDIIGQWVKQDRTCIMLNVKYRRLAKIRIHTDKDGKKQGCIRWRKGAGRTVEYYKPDIEKYLNNITIG